jgi:hypothetical protein
LRRRGRSSPRRAARRSRREPATAVGTRKRARAHLPGVRKLRPTLPGRGPEWGRVSATSGRPAGRVTGFLPHARAGHGPCAGSPAVRRQRRGHGFASTPARLLEQLARGIARRGPGFGPPTAKALSKPVRQAHRPAVPSRASTGDDASRPRTSTERVPDARPSAPVAPTRAAPAVRPAPAARSARPGAREAAPGRNRSRVCPRPGMYRRRPRFSATRCQLVLGSLAAAACGVGAAGTRGSGVRHTAAVFGSCVAGAGSAGTGVRRDRVGRLSVAAGVERGREPTDRSESSGVHGFLAHRGRTATLVRRTRSSHRVCTLAGCAMRQQHAALSRLAPRWAAAQPSPAANSVRVDIERRRAPPFHVSSWAGLALDDRAP